MFHQISKHLEVISKNSAARSVFNLLLSVACGYETHFLVFDALLQNKISFSLNCDTGRVSAPIYISYSMVLHIIRMDILRVVYYFSEPQRGEEKYEQ